ncbi:2-dehydropantoate 2-reductase [Helcococcus kunzii]|uniref:2-dehydropantoate 2-reductase n=1 Tax=Helcococcus kunzii TaxID=40091 RepID=UPI0021A65CAD|nr:2-dehydropantoate 2-reductase [Helcococcus kunzii]MCT1796176.1 2-dehydropantoate 2-reductase [Helcococcus kunzii]MCT1989211.1 2-dehydropantoate 2-reductase [Helcococcus kunzii]
MLTYIAGSGAMGCRFGYQLHNKGNEVILLDMWEDHINAIKENGLNIVGDKEDNVKIEIMKPSEAERKADFIILFTKAMQLPTMLESIKPIIKEDTKVLCLLNGLGHEDVMKQYLPEKNILLGVTVWTAGLKKPGEVLLTGTGSVNLQSIDKSGKEEALEIVYMMNEAGLNVTYDEDVLPSIWRKACVNGTMNSTCALQDCTIGEFFASEEAKSVVKTIISEFVTVGKALGVKLNEEEIVDYVFKTSVAAAEHYPSMHQDLIQNHRLTEIDFINGAVARKGKELGIDTPYCRMITDLIHSKEQILGIK